MKLSELKLNKVCYLGDCRWFFTIDANYSGYTSDKLLYHVLDHAANAYTSYDETKGEFTAYLESGTPKKYTYQTYPGENVNNGFSFDFSQTNWTPVIVGAAAIGLLLILK